MHPTRRTFLHRTTIAALACLPAFCMRADERRPIRVGVIGGMTMTGMWQELAAKFAADTGWEAILVITGPKDLISAPFKRGEIDLLTMHSSDQTTDLVANGFGENLRP